MSAECTRHRVSDVLFYVTSSRRHRLIIARAVIVIGLLILFCQIAPVKGAVKTWDADANSDWATASNWDSGVPGSLDTAKFDAATAHQPSISAANARVRGLEFATAGWDIGGTQELRVDSFGITSSGAGVNTISVADFLVGITQTWDVAVGNTLDITSAIGSGTWTVTKTGGGKVIFSGNNNGRFSLDVNAGSVWFNATHTDFLNHEVFAGASLGGSGVMNMNPGDQVIFNSGGTLKPGAAAHSIGTLTTNHSGALGRMEFLDGAIYQWDVTGPSPGQYDSVSTSNANTLISSLYFGTPGNVTLKINALDDFSPNAAEFVLFDYTGPDPVNHTWTLDMTNAPSYWDASLATVTVDTLNKQVILSGLTGIPEPATGAMLIAGLFGLTRTRRLRQS